MVIKPINSIESKSYDWIFQMSIMLAIIATIIDIVMMVKKKKYSKHYWIPDIIAIISAFLIFIYHYLYRWQLEIVIIFLLLLIAKSIYRLLKIFKFKNFY